ncbi:DNA-binding domain-containing protein, AraC-type [Opitutaceae bacterium TAV1]|nr:DNA-binding domain-containing protein, AraC-type [Opitutaceae bacterium TAV1]
MSATDISRSSTSPAPSRACENIDLNALDQVANRVLFSMEDFRWIGRKKEPASATPESTVLHPASVCSHDGCREGRLEIEGGASLQIVWLAGQAKLETAGGDGQIRLEPGTVWTSAKPCGPGLIHFGPGKHQRRTTGRGPALGLKFAFAAPLAEEYAHWLARHFGQFVQLQPGSDALRAARALALALEVAKPRETISRRVFAWLAALHRALNERRLYLQDLLDGKTDLLPSIFAEHGHSIKTLAGYLGCSPAYLGRQLQRAWQQPAQDVLHALRRQHAQHLLTSTSLGIGEVARRCGFYTTSSFATTFKRETGLTPTQARHMPFCADPHSFHCLPAKKRRSLPRRPGGQATPVAVWGDAFFQFDGGVSDMVYDTPFSLAMNAITNAVHWVVTLEGQAVFEAAGRSLRVTPGMVVIYPQPMNGQWTMPAGNGRLWKRIWLNVRCKWGIEAMLALSAAHGWAGMLPLNSSPVRLAREWVGHWHTHRNEPSVIASHAGFCWLQSWWELLHSGRMKRVTGPDGQAALPDLRQLLSKSFFRRIRTITDYAGQLGYSRRHTIRKLQAQWEDGTPAQIIRRQRLTQAALDLRHTRLSVEEIARKSQYSSTGSFIPAFRKEFGMTPLAWRLARL